MTNDTVVYTSHSQHSALFITLGSFPRIRSRIASGYVGCSTKCVRKESKPSPWKNIVPPFFRWLLSLSGFKLFKYFKIKEPGILVDLIDSLKKERKKKRQNPPLIALLYFCTNRLEKVCSTISILFKLSLQC